MKSNDQKNLADKIFSLLKENYPEAKSALVFNNPFELLIATILSAQCTDERVNSVTITLFKKYSNPQDYLLASNEELEEDIYSTGFYKQKAKSIKRCCSHLIKEHNSKVPADFNELTKLPGVGRKTASVIAGNAFGIPAIAVDTHVIRLSNRFHFVNTKNPTTIEKKLKELLPEKDWIISSHLLATHGRKICIARKPRCSDCFLANLCPSFVLISSKVKF
jgi:endonuclease-3